MTAPACSRGPLSTAVPVRTFQQRGRAGSGLLVVTISRL